MFRKSIAQQLLALKIGQPSLAPALSSSSAVSAAAAAPSPVQDHRTSIESNGGFHRASQWDPSPPPVRAQAEIKRWWSNRLSSHIKYHTKREKQELAAHQVRDRDEVFLDPQPSTANAGDLRLNKLKWWLNNLGVQRSPDQALFHESFIAACLPKIYGNEWNGSSIRVMNMFGLKKIRAEVTASVNSKTEDANGMVDSRANKKQCALC